MDGQGGFVFEHKENNGPGGWAIVGLGWLASGALFVIALAAFALANWIGVALTSLVQYVGIGVLLVSGGKFAVETCKGVAMIIEARGRAKALEKHADAHYVASVRAARIAPPQHYESPWREMDD
jgi:hypothetical protein